MKKTYKSDVDCANCANKMEEAAKATTGVKDATCLLYTSSGSQRGTADRGQQDKTCRDADGGI